MRQTDYELLCRQLEALTDGVTERVSNLANAASLLYNTLEDINWSGFYLLRGDTLVLGPFMGRPACVRISAGRGVCGTAAEKKETVLVPDVHLFPGHIACDEASRSEIVVPLEVAGELYGVMDIDSPAADRFSVADRLGLEAFARVLERALGQTEHSGKTYPAVSPEGFCGRFDRCASSLIEEPEYCEVCRSFSAADSTCRWPDKAQ